MPSDEAVLHPRADVSKCAMFKNDAAFNFAVLDGDIMVDAGEWADVAVFDDGVFADDGWAANDAIDDLRAAFDCYTTINLRIFDDRIRSNAGCQFFQDEAVGFEHIGGLASVNPPTFMDMRKNAMSGIHQPLNRVGDFQFAALGRFNTVDRFPNVGVEHINTDQRQIARWILGLLDELFNAAIGT